MATIPVRDTKLHVERSGEGEPALVFVHGMCGGAWGWEDQMSRLSDTFTCIAYDRRGHSRSPAGTGEPAEDQSDDSHADDAAALIEALDLDRPIVVSSSGGAVVAAELLRRHPELVRGAVLSEPPLFSIDPAAGQAFGAKIGHAVEQAAGTGGAEAAVDAFFELICPGLWAQLDEERKDRYRANAPMLFAAFQRRATTLTDDELRTIEVPVLVLSGTNSYPAFRSIAGLLARSLPDARLVELEGSGHVTYAERPVEFARAVRAFARELAATEPSR